MEESNLNKEAPAVWETITPDLAREYLKANIINRPLKPKVVDTYAERMRKGQWKMSGEPICFLKGGALGNGQHRLYAVIKTGIPITFLIVRGCDPDSLYVYDSGVNRTVADGIGLDGIPNSVMVASIVAKYFTIKADRAFIQARSGGIERGTKRIKKSTIDVIEEYNSSPELYQEIIRTVMSCVAKINLFSKAETGGFCAFLVKDRHHSLEVVTRFMRMLFWGEDVTNGTINVLKEKIVKDRMSAKSVMTSAYKQAILIKTWNAYITRKELKTLTYNKDKEGNLVIL